MGRATFPFKVKRKGMQHSYSISTKVKAIAIVLLGISCSVFIFFWQWQQHSSRIEIIGCILTTPEELLQFIAQHAATASPDSLYNQLTPKQIVQTLNKHPLITQSTIRKGYHSLIIHVQERQPLAYIISKNSVPKILFADTILPYRNFATPISLPTLTEDAFQQLQYSSLRNLLKNREITDISQSNSSIILHTIIPETVLLLDSTNIQEQISKLRFLADNPIGHEILRNSTRIDLRWSKKIVTQRINTR